MSDNKNYQLPDVWSNDQNHDGKFAAVNKPTAGARFERDLPRGDKPLQLYSLATPNGIKVNIMLEELLAAGYQEAAYDAHLIDIMDNDQFSSGFVAINPNSKIPALLDTSVTPALPIFESGAILLYLAEKFQAFIPSNLTERTECLAWLFWQVGSAPYVGGGFGHFYQYAPEKIPYCIDRFTMETKRQLDLLNQHLADKAYICGTEYTIADMAIFPWYGSLVLDRLYSAAKFLAVDSYPNVIAWAKRIDARPTVQKARLVTKKN